MHWTKLSTTLKVRLISNFFQEIITTAFLPFMALYLSDITSSKFTGIFLTILVLINFPISFLAGHLIESLPKKKSVLLYQFVMSIMLLGMAISLSSSHNVAVIFCILYAIFNVVWAIQYPTMDTIIMDAITPDIESYIFKFDYWLTNVAMVLGALIGGLVYHGNKIALFVIAFIIYIIIFVALYKWLPMDNKSTNSNHRYSDIHLSYKAVFKDRRYILLIIGFGIIMAGELSSSSYIAIRLKESFNNLQAFSIQIDGVKMYSILMVVNTIGVIFLTYHVSKLAMKLTQKNTLFLGLATYIIGYSSITFLNNFYLLIIFMLIATIGEIIYSPIFDEHRYKMTPKDKRGTYSAINNIGFNFSELIARLGIVLGLYLTSFQMSIYMLVILSIGGSLMYISIFKFK